MVEENVDAGKSKGKLILTVYLDREGRLTADISEGICSDAINILDFMSDLMRLFSQMFEARRSKVIRVGTDLIRKQ